MIADLRRIWQEAFGDTDAFLDGFFTAGFDRNRHHFIAENGIPVSALYWFDCELNGQKLAYIYAVATAENCRGRGLARKLMGQAHEILKAQGYAGAILVPGSKDLFALYEKMGYQPASAICEFSAQQGSAPVSLRQIGAEEFAKKRRQYLPSGGVLQEGATLSYLQTYCHFYAGEDFLLAARAEDDTLFAWELLGNTDTAPGILQALRLQKGRFRTPGNEREFAMYLPLTENCPKPTYFGLALD